jgi:hypothetical protein
VCSTSQKHSLTLTTTKYSLNLRAGIFQKIRPMFFNISVTVTVVKERLRNCFRFQETGEKRQEVNAYVMVY